MTRATPKARARALTATPGATPGAPIWPRRAAMLAAERATGRSMRADGRVNGKSARDQNRAIGPLVSKDSLKPRRRAHATAAAATKQRPAVDFHGSPGGARSARPRSGAGEPKHQSASEPAGGDRNAGPWPDQRGRSA